MSFLATIKYEIFSYKEHVKIMKRVINKGKRKSVEEILLF